MKITIFFNLLFIAWPLGRTILLLVRTKLPVFQKYNLSLLSSNYQYNTYDR